MQDESDSMSDYFNSRSTRSIVLAWSKHTRNLFPELRAAAARHEQTAHLATAPENAEHRENYSMGAGNYLQIGGRYSSGWRVRKCTLAHPSYCHGEPLEFVQEPESANQPAPKANQPEANQPAGGAFVITQHTHTKKGFQMWIATPSERVERDTFDSWLASAKALGGWYARAWAGTPAGFAFKVEAKARAFVGEAPAPQGPDKPKAPTSPAPEAAPMPAAPRESDAHFLAARFRAWADGMETAIADKFRDRLANTPKRARQAATARNEGAQLQRGQLALRRMADAIEAGTLPAVLSDTKTKSEVLDLALEDIEHKGGYYDAGTRTGRPFPWRDAVKAARAVAVFELVANPQEREARASDDLQRRIAALQFANIPGYFPTPAPVVARMLEEAALQPESVVLEPSAGSGAIAKALRDAGHSVACIERHATLAAILKDSGFIVNGPGDFLEHVPPSDDADKVDAVLMNPPFEDGQDVAHVRHAFQFVKPGGRLVAVMSGGVTFRQDKRTADFRQWLEGVGGTLEALPDGSFKASGTGVATVLCVIAL